MERQLVLKDITYIKKKDFKEELFETLLSLNLPEFPNKHGNKQFTTFQRLGLVILYFRSKLPLREFCDYINNESLWKRDFHLKYEIKKSTLNDWVKSFDLNFIKEILDQTNKGDKPKIIGIDGTGIDTKFKSSYYQKRLNDFGQKPKSNYHKLDIIADMEGKKKILDFSFFMKQQHDAKVAKRLFKRLKYVDVDIVADKGYYSFGLFSLMKLNNNNLIVPPKNYGKKCLHNRLIRKKFNQIYYENEVKYRLRNNVEGVFSTLKRTVLTKIVSKNSFTKKREMAFKIVLYNMKKNISRIFNFQLKILRF